MKNVFYVITILFLIIIVMISIKRDDKKRQQIRNDYEEIGMLKYKRALLIYRKDNLSQELDMMNMNQIDSIYINYKSK